MGFNEIKEKAIDKNKTETNINEELLLEDMKHVSGGVGLREVPKIKPTSISEDTKDKI